MKKYTLEQLCERIVGGGTPSTKNEAYWHGDIPWISSADIDEKGNITPKKYITKEAVQQSATNIVPKGTPIVVTRVGVGKSGVAPFDLCFSQDCQGLILKSDIANGHYCLKTLNSEIKRLITKSRGSTIKGVTKKALRQLKLPVPDNIEDQIRIATLLSHAEMLIAKRKESIRLLDDLLKSTFLEMFDSNAKGFKEWPVREIQQLAAKKKSSMRTGPFGSNLLHKEFTTEGDVAVLGIDNAVNNKFEWNEKRFISKEKYETLSTYRIYPRDVIITIMGTTGRSAVVPDDIPLTINTKHLAAITLNETEANPYFLSYSIHSSPFIRSQLRSKTRGAIMSGLNLGIIKKLKIKLPPVELQDHFEFILKRFKAIKTKYNASLHELENLYGSLSQRAFRGELDLSKIPIQHEVFVHDTLPIYDEASSTVISRHTEKYELTTDGLKALIQNKLPHKFTFEMLLDAIEEHAAEENQYFETIKDLLTELLQEKKHFLNQEFGQVETNETRNEEQKQIYFCVNK